MSISCKLAPPKWHLNQMDNLFRFREKLLLSQILILQIMALINGSRGEIQNWQPDQGSLRNQNYSFNKIFKMKPKLEDIRTLVISKMFLMFQILNSTENWQVIMMWAVNLSKKISRLTKKIQSIHLNQTMVPWPELHKIVWIHAK